MGNAKILSIPGKKGKFRSKILWLDYAVKTQIPWLG